MPRRPQTLLDVPCPPRAARPTLGSTTPRWPWSPWSWWATRGRCCPTRRSSRTSTTSSTPGTSRRSSSSPATCSRSFAWTRVRLWQLVRHGRRAVRPLRVRAGAVPDPRRRRAAGGPLPGPALADVVPLGAVLLAAAHAGLPSPCGAGWRWPWRSACSRGCTPATPSTMARVLGLLPFFVLGLKATPERLELLRSQPAQVAAVGVLVAIWVLTTWTDRWAEHRVALLPLPLRRDGPRRRPPRHRHPGRWYW